MTQIDNFILTIKGQSLLTAAQHKGLGNLNFTHIGIGDTAWNPDSSATRLQNERVRIPIKDDDVEDQGGGQLRIIGRFHDETSFKVQETGLYQGEHLVAIASNYAPSIEYEVFPQGITGINVEHTQDTSNAHYITEIENGKFKTTKFIDGNLETFFSPINNHVKISDNILNIEDLSILPDNFVVRVIGSVSQNAVIKHSWMTYISEVFFQIGQTPVEHITVNSQPLHKTYVDLTPLQEEILSSRIVSTLNLLDYSILRKIRLIGTWNETQQHITHAVTQTKSLITNHTDISNRTLKSIEYQSDDVKRRINDCITELQYYIYKKQGLLSKISLGTKINYNSILNLLKLHNNSKLDLIHKIQLNKEQYQSILNLLTNKITFQNIIYRLITA